MLRAAHVARIVMVTGDHAAAAQTIGAALDLDAVLADRVPSDKVDAVRSEQRLYPTTRAKVSKITHCSSRSRMARRTVPDFAKMSAA